LVNRKFIVGGIVALAIVIIILLVIFLSGKNASPGSEEPTKDANVVLTEIYQTAEGIRMASASAMVSPSPTQIEITLTPTQSITATTQVVTPTPGSTAAPGALRVQFVQDVTVPDGTSFAPNTPFTKTWRIRNAGTTAWTPAFSLVFQSGEQMGGPSQTPLVSDVAPGATIDISINMISPANPGRYIGNWMMRDPNGTLFGVDPDAKYPIYIDITVTGAAGTPSPSPALGTGTPTPTATSSQGAQVSNVTLVVDNPSASSCPHTFSFTASFTLSQASTVSYKLEAGASDPNVTINLPAPVTTNLQAGIQTVVYVLDFNTAVQGWAQLHVSAPQDVVSSRVDFTLTCQP